MSKDGIQKDDLELIEVPELLEMEMEEYDEFRDRYSEVTGKTETLLKNFLLMKISNKRNEINILYLYQKLNAKKINSEDYEKVFTDLDNLYDEISSKNYKYDELVAKNNELGRRINPMIRELMK